MPYLSPDDRLSAAREAFRASYLPTDPSDLSPIARELVSQGPFSMSDLAEAVVEARVGPGAVSRDPFRNVVQALGTADFPSAVSETAAGIARERPSAFLDDLLAITSPISAENYNASSLSLVDLGEVPLPSATTGDHFWFIQPRISGERTQLFSLFARLLASVQVLTNDDRNFLPSALGAFTNACHRSETARVAAILENTSALEDGTALFDAARGNLKSGAGIDSAGFGVAFSALRLQPAEGGQPAGAPCRAVVVHPADECAALGVVEALPAESRPRIVPNPYLADASAWYALGDPLNFPTIGRVTFRGADPSAIAIGSPAPAVYTDRDGVTHEYPGISLDLTHSVGLVVVSPVGAVKLAKA